MSEGIIIAIITGGLGLIGVVIGVAFKKKGKEKSESGHHNLTVNGDNNTSFMINK